MDFISDFSAALRQVLAEAPNRIRDIKQHLRHKPACGERWWAAKQRRYPNASEFIRAHFQTPPRVWKWNVPKTPSQQFNASHRISRGAILTNHPAPGRGRAFWGGGTTSRLPRTPLEGWAPQRRGGGRSWSRGWPSLLPLHLFCSETEGSWAMGVWQGSSGGEVVTLGAL